MSGDKPTKGSTVGTGTLTLRRLFISAVDIGYMMLPASILVHIFVGTLTPAIVFASSFKNSLDEVTVNCYK